MSISDKNLHKNKLLNVQDNRKKLFWCRRITCTDT